MKNTVTFTGNIGRNYKFYDDVQTRIGKTVKITYSVAEHDGEETIWRNCSAYGNKALAAKALFDAHPGCQVTITGEFNAANGKTRTIAETGEIVAASDWVNNAAIAFIQDTAKVKAEAAAAMQAVAEPSKKARSRKTA